MPNPQPATPLVDEATPAQIERANAAVESNLIDGSPKYGSAQGYACALTAIMQTDAAKVEAEKEVEWLREALKSVKIILARVNVQSGYCCCGSRMEDHDIGSDHSPVDSDQYMAQLTIEQIDAVLTHPTKEQRK